MMAIQEQQSWFPLNEYPITYICHFKYKNNLKWDEMRYCESKQCSVMNTDDVIRNSELPVTR